MEIVLLFVTVMPSGFSNWCCYGLKYNFFPIVLPLKKSAIQSSTANNLGAHLATDEDVNTCSFAGNLADKWSWWRVELDGVFDITEVVLSFIPNTPYSQFMNDLKVYISLDNDDYEQNLCTSYKRQDSLLYDSPLNLTCSTPIAGKFVTIRRDGGFWFGYLSLCEVNVYGGGQSASLSLKKPTTQNGILFQETSHLAVDGNVSTCTKVLEKKYKIAWWRVTLDDVYYVSNVTIFYDPNNADSHLLNNFEIYVSTNAQDLHQQLCTTFYDFNNTFHYGSMSLPCYKVQSGRFVTIQKFGGSKPESLFFCEVLVWGSEYRFSNVCKSGELICLEEGICIPKYKICNGIRDCSDNIDEHNCNCSEFQYKCKEAQCIHKDWLCDGTKDCPKGDDEEVASCQTCGSTEFKCAKNNVCIELTLRCNGIIDCMDSSDETGCLELESSLSRLNIPRFLAATFKGQKNFYVCSDNWFFSHSLYACRQMGKTIYDETASASLATTKILRLKARTDFEDVLLFMKNFDKSSYCESQKFVQISCPGISDSECGTRSFPDDVLGPYIINGERAKLGAWPWHVQIFNMITGSICGGSLIRRDWVLTAAHCLDGITHVSQVQMKYGSIISDDRSTEINSAKRYGVHPNYRRKDLLNDVGLIQLKYPIRFNKVTRPICLPTKKLSDAVLRSFKYCVVSGFGDINKDGWGTTYLLQGRMNLMSIDECISNLKIVGRDPEEFYRRQLANGTFICAGSSPTNIGTTACKQDSGGPLVCRDEHGLWTQIGIIRGGFWGKRNDPCANSILSRVDSYLFFIESFIEAPRNETS